jgi:hypothetical protein
LDNNEITNILWTGGWDSTFRLLDLLMIKEKSVQPWYIIDPYRRSTLLELRAMREIKKNLFIKFPKTVDLLRPNIFLEVYDIKPDNKITESFKRINEEYPWGTQYEWLARFANEQGLKNLEMCWEKGFSERSKYFRSYLIKVDDDNDPYYKFNSKYEQTDYNNIFKYYKFPIIEITKLDMVTISRQNGFNEFMEMTWFCHRPRSNNKPCGTCNPCILTIKKGLGRRLPFTSRLRFYFCGIINIKRLLKKYSGFYNFLKKIKHKFN